MNEELRTGEALTRRARLGWLLIILASFAFQSAVLQLQAGYASTPFGTADSAGNRLGFNNPITFELIWIMIGNIRLKSLVDGFGWYFLLCLAAHLVALGLIWRRSSRRTRMLYFSAQTIVFPLGWFPLFWAGPMLAASCFFGTFDGESIADGPLNMFWAHITWWQVSIALFLWDLGLAEAWRDLRKLAGTAPTS